MLYIFDNTETLLTTLPEGSFFVPVHHDVLNGENTYTFSFPGNQTDAQYIVKGNLVGFKDLDSYWQIFEIKRLVDSHGDGLIRQAYCEHILYELLDDIVTDKRPSADATAALAGMLENTRWNVGIVDDLGASSTTAYYISALEAVQNVATAWQGELNWRCVVEGGVIARYVDLRAIVGTDTGKQFVYSKDIISIEREADSSGVVTALYGRGKGVETETGDGYGRRLTFADVVAADKPAGQEWVGDADALVQWGRNGRHRFDVFIDEDEVDPAALLAKTRTELAKRTTPRVTYRLDVVSLEELAGYEHEKVRKGDLVRVIDREFKPELIISARVIDIERDILDPSNTKVVLGSFAPTIIEATINTQKQVYDMANRPYNTKWLDGKISVLQNAIESAMSNWWTDENGNLIFEAQDGLSAMKLAGEGFAIANSRTENAWNWRTFGNGSGFAADLMTTGILDAALVQIGHATTFEPGYDPSKISTANMFADSDCTLLCHFDGSLNSHKGLTPTFTRNSVAYLSDGTQVAAGVPRFESTKFAYGWWVEEGTINSLQFPSELDNAAWAKEGSIVVTANQVAAPDGTLTADKISITAAGITNRLYTSASLAIADGSQANSVWLRADAPTTVRLQIFNNNGGAFGAYVNCAVTTTWQRFSVVGGVGNTTTGHLCIGANGTTIPGTFYAWRAQLESKPYPTSSTVGTRAAEVMTIPTAGIFNKGNWTVSFVFTPTSDQTKTYNGLWEVWIDQNNRYLIGTTNAGRLYVQVVSGGVIATISPAPVLQVGTNYTIVLTGDGITLSLFQDGLLKQSIAYTEPVGTIPTNMSIGTTWSNTYFANGIIDELRIDKVARTNTEIAGWYKAQAPFYSSEDVKQWPGYVRADTEGIKVYDSEGVLRVVIGSWLVDLLRKYGIKIIGGEIYSTKIQSGDEGATSYVKIAAGFEPLSIVENGKTALNIWSSGGGMIQFYSTNLDDMVGQLVPMNDAGGQGLRIQGRSSSGGSRDLHLAGRQVMIDPINGNLNPYNDLGGSCGSNSKRWTLVRGYYVTSGDLCFEETTCAICGKTFADGEILCLMVKTVTEEYGTMTIPVHEGCKGLSKMIEVQMPELVTKYRLGKTGEREAYKDFGYEETSETVIVLHPDYELDEDTGKFKRRLTDGNLELFSEDEISKGVFSSEKVAKAIDMINRRKLKFTTITMQIGTQKG